MTSPSAASTTQGFAAGLEPDIIRRAQAGDSAAFEQLYRAHSPRVYALCLRLSGGTRDEATELMQDVFIRAWRSLNGFRGDSAFSSWLHRLAVNAMLENARAEKRRTARVVRGDDSMHDAAATSAQPGLNVDLERAIAALPEGARMAFVLHEVEGYQHAEIAKQLGIAEGTVKAQLHRARKLLIEALDR
jgi:RNA polymerase sigma-70 factor (ECF subfamily)